jgi:hypothetical protein
MENLFVINGHQCEVLIPNKPNIHVLKEDNCSDLEGYLNGIKFFENKYSKPIWEIFDYLCIINASSFGPIFEENIDDHWIIPFYDRMVKYNSVICSPCMTFLPNSNPGGPGPKVIPIFSLIRCTQHIIQLLTQQQISCTDRLSIDNYYKQLMIYQFNTHMNTVFGKKYDKQDACLTGEYGLSRILIQNGYKLCSLLYDFDCHDEQFWNINQNLAPDRYNSFNGKNVPLSTIFIKHLWRYDTYYVSLPLLYNECIDFMYSKLNMKPILQIHDNEMIKYNYDLLKTNENNKENYYNIYGKVEEDLIFCKSQNNDCVIYAHYDADNIIKDYVFQTINALLYVGYDIIFFTSSEKINNIDPNILPFAINYIKNEGPGTDWQIWSIACKQLVQQNRKYDNILLLNDSIILPVNGIDNLKNTIKNMRETSDFWGHWESNEIEWHIIGAPIEFKYKMIHDIINFFDTYLNDNYSNQSYYTYCINNLEIKLASYLVNKGYKYNTVIKLNILNNNLVCPVFNPLNINKWINNPETFALKWKYSISYLHPNLVSPYLNYLFKYMYYGKYGTISNAEKEGSFIQSYYEL